MSTYLTTKQVADMFQVTERTITQKFIKEGLKYIPVGSKDYRFDLKDVLEFIETRKQIAQEKLESAKSKTKSKTCLIDFQKREYNRVYNKVI